MLGGLELQVDDLDPQLRLPTTSPQVGQRAMRFPRAVWAPNSVRARMGEVWSSLRSPKFSRTHPEG